MNRKSAAAYVGKSESWISKATERELKYLNLYRRGDKSNTTYEMYDPLKKGDGWVDWASVYAEKKVAKIEADKALVLQKTAAHLQKQREMWTDELVADIEESFRGYAELLKSPELDKEALIEEWGESWAKLKTRVSSRLRPA